MRKTITAVLAASLALGAFALPSAEAAKKKKPKVTQFDLAYGSPAVGTSGVGACSGCPSFSVGDDDNYISVESTDDVSPTTHLSFSWDTDGDGVTDTGFTVCGATPEPIALPGATTIAIFPWALPGAECPTGASTSGTISITLSKTL
jgi:hypothetical protein